MEPLTLMASGAAASLLILWLGGQYRSPRSLSQFRVLHQEYRSGKSLAEVAEALRARGYMVETEDSLLRVNMVYAIVFVKKLGGKTIAVWVEPTDIGLAAFIVGLVGLIGAAIVVLLGYMQIGSLISILQEILGVGEPLSDEE